MESTNRHTSSATLSQTQRDKSTVALGWALVPAMLALIAFLPVLSLQFAFDDSVTITSDLAFEGATGLMDKLLPSDQQKLGETTWRPLISATYLLTYAAAGANPRVHHALDWLLHALVTFLLAALMLRLGFSPVGSTLGALVFALHPIMAGTVAMISFREEPLVASLGLLALLLYSGRNRILRAGALGLFFITPFAKETGVAFGFLPLYQKNDSDASRIKRALPAIGLSVLSVALLFGVNRFVTGGLDVAGDRSLPYVHRFLVAGTALFYYARRFFLWGDLSPVHDDLAVPDALTAQAAVGLLILAALSIVLLRGLKRPSVGALAAGLVLLPLVPTLNILLPFWIRQADRFCYIPLLGVGIAAAWGIDALLQRRGVRQTRLAYVVLAGTIGVLILFTATLWREIPRYRDSYTLFSSVVKRQPESDLGRLWLAKELLDRHQYEQALRLLEPNLARHPDNLKTANFMAEALVQLGRPTEAIAILEKLDLAGHDGPHAALTLQAAYFMAGQFEPGWALTRHWMDKENPTPTLQERLLSNAAVGALNAGQRSLAVGLAKAALQINPDSTSMRRLVTEFSETPQSTEPATIH